MEILHWLAGYAEEHFQNLGYSPTEVIEQFSRELRRETDLRREGRNCDRLRAAHKDNPNVHVPIVHWQSTTRNVLTMEEIDGTLLSRLDKDQVSKQDLERIVANGADAVFHQCLEVGFFHADPHPGNIVAQAEGKICFIDCGMTGHIDPKTARQLADLVQGTISGDVDRVVDVIITFGDADPALASDRAFRADVWDFISRFDDATFADLDMGALLNDFFEKIRAHGLRCPADIVFLIKAITTIEGVGEQLAPDFPLVDYVQPYVERLVRQHYGIGALRRRLQGTIADYTQMLEELPAHARSLVYDLRRNQLTINLEHHGLKELSETIDRSTGNVANAVFVAALIMGSSILVLADSTSDGHGWLSVVAGIGFFVALIIIFLRVVITRFR
jgi:ubiquinone biosynthesis protein